ncbi:hypothetical protein AVEN_189046-1 [Araneus ventricosus]|uniref:Uncharacterized protein n=1 Tax=Araneus ventricosus TaxID=182803 RepID=A0A4Y2S9V2_ARAVE|nr:hypothetical protein AVEN_189046-1 [Araneus ventricosus]
MEKWYAASEIYVYKTEEQEAKVEGAYSMQDLWECDNPGRCTVKHSQQFNKKQETWKNTKEKKRAALGPGTTGIQPVDTRGPEMPPSKCWSAHTARTREGMCCPYEEAIRATAAETCIETPRSTIRGRKKSKESRGREKNGRKSIHRSSKEGVILTPKNVPEGGGPRSVDLGPSDVTLGWIQSIPQDSSEGYIFEVDLKYPEELHDLHNDYPLAPEKMDIKFEDLSEFSKAVINGMKYTPSTKLVPNLKDKKNYITHYKNLQFYLKHGLK